MTDAFGVQVRSLGPREKIPYGIILLAGSTEQPKTQSFHHGCQNTILASTTFGLGNRKNRATPIHIDSTPEPTNRKEIKAVA